MRLAEELKLVTVERLPPNELGLRHGAVRLTKSALRLVEFTLGDL